MAYMAVGGILGDIGTSPLYVMAIVFAHLKPTWDNILVILSLITLSFVFLTLKYAYLALNLDNEGEGGTFALFTLIKRHAKILKEKGINDYRVMLLVGRASGLSLLCGAFLMACRVIRSGRRYRLTCLCVAPVCVRARTGRRRQGFGRCSPGFEAFKEAYNQPVFA
jgi:hypothetical protein